MDISLYRRLYTAIHPVPRRWPLGALDRALDRVQVKRVAEEMDAAERKANHGLGVDFGGWRTTAARHAVLAPAIRQLAALERSRRPDGRRAGHLDEMAGLLDESAEWYRVAARQVATDGPRRSALDATVDAAELDFWRPVHREQQAVAFKDAIGLLRDAHEARAVRGNDEAPGQAAVWVARGFDTAAERLFAVVTGRPLHHSPRDSVEEAVQRAATSADRYMRGDRAAAATADEPAAPSRTGPGPQSAVAARGLRGSAADVVSNNETAPDTKTIIGFRGHTAEVARYAAEVNEQRRRGQGFGGAYRFIGPAHTGDKGPRLERDLS